MKGFNRQTIVRRAQSREAGLGGVKIVTLSLWRVGPTLHKFMGHNSSQTTFSQYAAHM